MQGFEPVIDTSCYFREWRRKGVMGGLNIVLRAILRSAQSFVESGRNGRWKAWTCNEREMIKSTGFKSSLSISTGLPANEAGR